MARRRKQAHDPRQLSFFDFMANQIEEIREENILDDMREEHIPAPAAQVEQEQSVSVTPETELKKEEEIQPEPARTEKPFPFPTNDGDKRRLGVNGRGDSVYEMRDGSRMYSPNTAIMQFLDGEKRTPEKLFEDGADDYLTIQEISEFTHTLSLEVQHARQANLSARNRTKGSQARNHQRREKRGIHQFGLFDSGSMGAEQPRKAENAGGDGDFGFVGDSGSTGNHREQSTEQRGSSTGELAGDVGFGDIEGMGIDMSLKITE